MKSFLIFGTLPPPIGGVTISLKNLFKALNFKGKDVYLFGKKSLMNFQRYDVGHIHYLKRWKILVAIFISNLLCKKTILTYHGVDFYPNDSFKDKLILNLIDGLIVLNQELYDRCYSFKKEKIIKLTPLLQEGLNKESFTEEYFEKCIGKKYILLYAYDKVFTNGIEVYGVRFILNLLDRLNKQYILVFVDPKSAYESELQSIDKNNLIYLNQYVKFTDLLQKVELYIRPTNFDGNSVATLEALSFDVPVLASDSVERDSMVTVYKNNDDDDFLRLLDECLKKRKSETKHSLPSVDDYIKFCEK